MARPVTRSEFARMAGVSPAAITKACKGSLRAALHGKRIDLDHAAAVEYLKSKGASPTLTVGAGPKKRKKATKSRPSSGRRRPPKPPQVQPPSDLPDAQELTSEEIEGLAHHTLEELIERYGTATALKDWLDARKKIADIREKDLKNGETQGRLIPRTTASRVLRNA